MFLVPKLCSILLELVQLCNATAMTARRSFDVAGKNSVHVVTSWSET